MRMDMKMHPERSRELKLAWRLFAKHGNCRAISCMNCPLNEVGSTRCDLSYAKNILNQSMSKYRRNAGGEK